MCDIERQSIRVTFVRVVDESNGSRAYRQHVESPLTIEGLDFSNCKETATIIIVWCYGYRKRHCLRKIKKPLITEWDECNVDGYELAVYVHFSITRSRRSGFR